LPAHNHQEESNQLAKDVVVSSTAFKYNKFHHALQWYKENQSLIHASDSIIPSKREFTESKADSRYERMEPGENREKVSQRRREDEV
jgi:hypothetical protein